MVTETSLVTSGSTELVSVVILNIILHKNTQSFTSPLEQ